MSISKNNKSKIVDVFYQSTDDQKIEANQSAVGTDFFVIIGRGWIGRAKKVIDAENILLEDEYGHDHSVSIYKLRGLEKEFAA